MTDLSALSNEDLLALKAGDIAKVSNEGLLALRAAKVQNAMASSQDPSLAEAKKIKSEYVDPLALAAQGVNKAVVGAGDAILNTPNRVGNLLKAGYGTIQDAMGHPENAPQLTPDPNYLSTALTKAGVFNQAFDPKTEGQQNAVSLLQAGTAGLMSPADSGKQILSNAITSMAGGGGAILAKKAGADPMGQTLAAILAQMGTSAGMNMAGDKIDQLASEKSKNSTADANNANARELGLSLSAEDTNPNKLTGAVESLANKPLAQKIRSRDNAEVVNNVARQELNLPKDAPLNPDTLKQVRDEAYQTGYAPMKELGDIMPGPQYFHDLQNIKSKYESAAESFPKAVRDDVSNLVSSLDETTVNSANAVDMIRILRDDASKDFRSGDNALGFARKDAAKAMESMLERASSNQGANGAELASNFRDARQTIAKAYTIEDALGKDGVNVSAQKLAQALRSGEPLSGDLKVVAESARTYPRSFQPPEQLGDLSSKLSIRDQIPAMVAGGTGGYLSGSPATGAAIAGVTGAIPLIRPAARALATSQWYQNKMGTPNYNPSILTKLLSNGEVQNPAANSAMLAAILNNR